MITPTLASTLGTTLRRRRRGLRRLLMRIATAMRVANQALSLLTKTKMIRVDGYHVFQLLLFEIYS